MSRPARFDDLRMWCGLGIEVPEATTFASRLLGLAWLDRDRAGVGLFLPRCSSVHTFGMRFELDLVFLDRRGRPLRKLTGVPPRRIAGCSGSRAVLEIVPTPTELPR